MSDTPNLQEINRHLDELLSREAIRECINRIVRGIDRLDTDLVRSGFHPDAKVQWHSQEPFELDDWLGKTSQIKLISRRSQHLVSNTLIDLDGDKANVESYEIARHLTNMGEEWKDLIIASRYLDKFSRRDGVWKIDSRIKMMDWARIMEGEDGAYDRAPLKGSQDEEDLSYKIFGPKAFL